MARPWDDNMKKLVRADPEAFVQWLFPQGTFSQFMPADLKLKEFEVDGLVQATCQGTAFLLNIEFQSTADATMAERLLRYHVLARCEYKLPVLSYVIYLFEEEVVPASPLRWRGPTGQEVLQFHFTSIELAKLSVHELRRIGHSGLLPLLPLTEGGTARHVLSEMLTDLQEAAQPDVTLVGYTLASLVLSRKNDTASLQWLFRRFSDMHDLLRDSPIYQVILNEGLAQGLTQGRNEGRTEGRQEGFVQGQHEGELQALRDMLVRLVEARFPGTQRIWLQERLATLREVGVLQDLILRTSQAATIKEVEHLVIAAEASGEIE